MSTTWRILLLLLVWLVYSLLGLRYCADTVCTGCEVSAAAPIGTDTSSAPTPAVSYQRYPIDFSFGEAEPNLNPGYDSLRQSILASAGESAILTITGLYFPQEPAPAGTEGMGLARAGQVRDLFEEDIPADRIQIRARSLTGEPMREGYFEGVEFSVEEAAVALTPDLTVQLEELTDRIIFRFPFNSTREEYDPEVVTMMRELAEDLKATDKKIRVVGHTDNSGPSEYNMRLGRDRAMTIFEELVAMGVPRDQVLVESKGETQPVAPNDSDENRHLNRRVEIHVAEN